jgi:hypothetical protein
MTYKGRPVKANRLFAGYEHELQTKKIATHFKVPPDFYKKIKYDPLLVEQAKELSVSENNLENEFPVLDLEKWASVEIAYCKLMLNIIERQIKSTNMVLEGTAIKRIFVDGGFGNNDIYMNLLAQAFPHVEVYAASMAQATAVGAALAIHNSWNTKPLLRDIIKLKFYGKASVAENN